ncbi:MAG: adenylate/guanylate cyclase domain-containing protein [Planctomycetota bacterium]|nr:adenylate/guanylate cyclase domain-containing protein [Planctomycetota bacterium]
MPSVSYQPDGVEVDVQDGESLLAAARRAGLPHAQVCGGAGQCSTCRVLIEAGLEHCSARGAREEKVAKRLGFGPAIRLACQTRVAGAVRARRLVVDERDTALANLLQPERAIASIGVQRELAVFFCDIRDFTTLSEGLTPYDVIHLLNRFFERVEELVARHGGTVNNLMGDGFMALFGFRDPRQACARAVRCGLELIAAAEDLSPYAERLSGKTLRIGVGIHYGPVVLGALGPRSHTRLAAIGDTVNMASRVESQTKAAGAKLLISAACRERIAEGLSLGRELRVELKGKAGTHALHEVLGLA